GVRMILHVLIVTFPFSNMRYAQAYRGETAECVCHGLRTIFDHVGMVPTMMVFDNATGIGKRIAKQVVETTLFSAFRLHYRAHSRYCNPDSGHDYAEDSVIPSWPRVPCAHRVFLFLYSG